MSESMIEMIVESMFNDLDRRFMRSSMRQSHYDRECAKIRKWADREYARNRKPR